MNLTEYQYFYDLYYLTNDRECATYIQSGDFQKDLEELLLHDQREFDDPEGWQTKSIAESPLISSFSNLWENLRSTYQSELTSLVFGIIPDEKLIAESFVKITQQMIMKSE